MRDAEIARLGAELAAGAHITPSARTWAGATADESVEQLSRQARRSGVARDTRGRARSVRRVRSARAVQVECANARCVELEEEAKASRVAAARATEQQRALFGAVHGLNAGKAAIARELEHARRALAAV